MRSSRGGSVRACCWRAATAAVLLASALVLASGVGSIDASAASSVGSADGASALLVDDEFSCPTLGPVWAKLSLDWADYGSLPLTITSICGVPHFSLQDLEASGADTLILDGTAFGYTLTPDEIEAIQTYAKDGHTVVGVGPVFKWNQYPPNNGLAPIFGLAGQSPWRQHRYYQPITFNKLRKGDPDADTLFRELPTYVTGYGTNQR